MPLLKLETTIHAPLQTCFDLSRSIDAHVGSMAKSKETAIAGTTTGLIGLNETVTWRAKHFGIVMKMTVKITQLHSPYSFTDEMMDGPFAMLKHKHTFRAEDNMVVMVDDFEYKSPLGVLGKMADKLFLKTYMLKLLKERNAFIKSLAEQAHASAQ